MHLQSNVWIILLPFTLLAFRVICKLRPWSCTLLCMGRLWREVFYRRRSEATVKILGISLLHRRPYYPLLQGWRNNNLSAVLFNLRDEKPQRRKAFLLRWNGISYIPVVPIASCPSRGHQWEEYVSISLTPSHQVIHIGKSPWSPYPSLNEFRQRHPFTQRSPICFNNTKANKYQGWWISVKSLEIVGLCYKGFCL